MDETDGAVARELERRLVVLAGEGHEAPQPTFPRPDMVVLVALVVLSVLAGLLVGLG